MLRGLAAVAVVIDHVTHYMHQSFDGESWLYSSNIYNVGGFGVDLFFCISGFIMVITTYNRPSGLSQSLSFLKKRFLRIYPTYWFYCIITITLPLILYGKTDLISKYDSLFLLQSFLLLPAKISEKSFSPFLGQGWTLQYELYFYILFALTIIFFKGFKVPFYCALLMISMLIISLNIDINSYVDYLASNTIIIDFIMGMLSAYFYVKVSAKGISINIRTGLALVVILISLISYIIINKYPIDRIIVFGIPSFFIVTIFSLINVNPCSLTNRVIIQAGEASYTIYLAHMIFIWTAIKYSYLLKYLYPDAAILLVSLVICIFSYLLYLSFEKPLTNRLMSIRKKQAQL
ncbi:acyltransferase family protein [Escherichia coli]|nr:acyltransferase [Escherichia coli]